MDCIKCTLSGQKTIGRGSDKPKIMFVGEAPGAEEEKQGIPFVGKSGQILESILNYLQLTEEDYYITNVCLCRPPENRTPTKQEIACCLPRLLGEIDAKKPQVIVALGKTPADVLFGTANMRDRRGKILQTLYADTPGIATYHPAATLYAKGDTLFPYILGDIEKAKQITISGIPSEKDTDTEVVIINSPSKADYLIDALSNLPEKTDIVFDWETTGLSPQWDTGFCLGLSWKEGTAATLPMEYIRRYREQLAKALNKHNLIGFNAVSFDSMWNEKYGLPHKVDFDPMLWHYLLDERPQKRSLENLTALFLNAPCYETEMMAKYKAKKKSMIELVPSGEIYTYCGKDVDWTLRLYNHFKECGFDSELHHLYTNLLHPAAEAFTDIKRHGLWVDLEVLNEVDREMTDRVVGGLAHLWELTGNNDFNPNSHQQVQQFLWDELKLEEPKLYNRKERSADGPTLEWLIENYPDNEFIPALKTYRDTFTLYSRYVRGLTDFIESDNRVRVDYHFDRTETGRLSTTNPAIHTIPREESIRRIFSAPPGHTLIQADYEQVEIRMAAHVAGDRKLTEFLTSGADFHSTMASQAFRVPLGEVTPTQRQAAKGVSFGLLYLMSDKGLIVQTGLPKGEAIEFVKSYKALMPDVQTWIEDTKAAIRTEQFITSPFGRRRRFPLVMHSNLSGLYREGVNFPIQSGASDLTLSAVVKLNYYFKMYYPEAKVVIMVHDSIVVECPEVIAEDIAGLVKRTMEDVPIETDVPFTADVKIGRRWGEYDK